MVFVAKGPTAALLFEPAIDLLADGDSIGAAVDVGLHSDGPDSVAADDLTRLPGDVDIGYLFQGHRLPGLLHIDVVAFQFADIFAVCCYRAQSDGDQLILFTVFGGLNAAQDRL